MSKISKKSVCVIGGGTGTIPVLSGLKKIGGIELSVIVSMSDDGGSNQIVRDEFGLLPLSDIRKSIIALASTDNLTLRKLFNYRFEKGNGLSGHTIGNLIMMALSDMEGDELGAIKKASHLFNCKGKIIPVTLEKTVLMAECSDGKIISEEHNIDKPQGRASCKIKSVFFKNPVPANPDAVSTILEADYIVIGPGDIYTSLIPNLLFPEIINAFVKTKAKIIYIVNLITKNGQTTNMSATDLVKIITENIHRKIDYVIMNNKTFPSNVLKKYEEAGEKPIKDDLTQTPEYEIIRADVLSPHIYTQEKGDWLVRSLIRHDAEKIAEVLDSII